MRAFALFFLINNFCYGQWTHVNPGTIDEVVDISFPTDQFGYALDGNTGKIWTTLDGGSNWSFLNNLLLPYRISFLTIDTGFSINESGLFKSIDGGNNWDTVLNNPNLFWQAEPYFIDGQTGWIAQTNYSGDSLLVYKSNNGGEQWNVISVITDSIGFGVSNVEFTDSLTGYILTTMLSLLKTIDGGLHWSVIHYGPPVFDGISFITPDTGFAFNNQFYRTFNGGLSWDSFPLPTVPFNGQIHFLSSSLGYICGGNGINSGFILKTTDGGLNWIIDFNDTYTYTSLTFPSSYIGYSCGTGGSIIKTNLLNNIRGETKVVSEFLLGPNPFFSFINVRFKSRTERLITITNITGNIIYEKYSSTFNEQIDLSELQNGFYFVRISGDQFDDVIKLVKSQ
jgi:photosystem II stability/assembly factor-like uncharacterized protein